MLSRLDQVQQRSHFSPGACSTETDSGDVVLTKAKRLSELPGLGYEVLYAKNGIVLIRIKA